MSAEPGQYYRIPTGGERVAVIAKIGRFLHALPGDQAFSVSIQVYKPRRSNEQNALMWVLFDQIIAKGGEAMRGWTKDDLKDFLCGEIFGWEEFAVFGRKRLRPIHGTSGLNKQQMSDFLDSIVRFMAEKGIYLDLPGDHE